MPEYFLFLVLLIAAFSHAICHSLLKHSKNPLGLPIPEFKPEIQVEIRLAYAGGKVSFKVNGKEIPARNGSIRAQSRLVKFKDKSPYNLDDPKSIQAMFAKMKK